MNLPSPVPLFRSRFSTLLACLGLSWLTIAVGQAQGDSTGLPPPLPAVVPAVTITVPFDFSQNVAMLDVDLGGSRPAHLVFDTGNTPTVVDTEVAHEMGLPLLDKEKIRAGSGAAAFTYYRITPSKFRVGTAPLAAKQIAVAPVRAQMKTEGVSCDGCVGYGAFRNRIVQLDYPARQLRFLDAADAKATAARGQSFAISWKKYWSGSPNLVTVDDVQLGGHRLAAQVDLFFQQPAILFSTKLPWLQTQPAHGATSVQYEGAALIPVQLKGSLTLGDSHLAGHSLAYMAGPGAHIPETDLAVVLGSGFFRQDVLTIDFPASRLIVESPRVRPS